MKERSNALLAPVFPEGTYSVMFRNGALLAVDVFDRDGLPDTRHPMPMDQFMAELSGQLFVSLKVEPGFEKVKTGSFIMKKGAHSFEMFCIGKFGTVTGVEETISLEKAAFARKPDKDEGNWCGGCIISTASGEAIPLGDVLLYAQIPVTRFHYLYVGFAAIELLDRAFSSEMPDSRPKWSPGVETILQLIERSKQFDLLRKFPSALPVGHRLAESAEEALARARAELHACVTDSPEDAMRMRDLLARITGCREKVGFYSRLFGLCGEPSVA